MPKKSKRDVLNDHKTNEPPAACGLKIPVFRRPRILHSWKVLPIPEQEYLNGEIWNI